MEQRSIIYNELGAFCLAEKEGKVVELGFLGKEYSDRKSDTQSNEKYSIALSPLGEQVAGELTEYLSGQRREFSFPVQPEGTPFQRKVWKALQDIPYGETRTYGQIAALVGSPRGARAVGMACNRNPVMIVIPCHRVLGSNGSLTGYACGLDIKKKLLELEAGSCRK